MNARPAGGQVTGLRAGQPEGEGEGNFSGAFIVDDPIKPDDRFSEPIVKKINERFNGTFRSRLMQERVTPMIVIMQRIAENDPSGFLLRGGTGEKWHHLCLPVLINNSKPYPEKYTHGIPIEHGLDDGPLWGFKHNEEEIEALKIDPFTYASQYDQDPSPLGGGLFKDEWWQYYIPGEVLFDELIIVADTAQKVKEHNDFSVFQCWGRVGQDIYLVDQIRGKWEAPELLRKARDFWNKHWGTGNSRTKGRLKYMAIEDKSSGTGLIQQLKAPTEKGEARIPVTAIQRNIDKLTRAMDTVPFISAGRVMLPIGAPFLLDFKAEFGLFSADMTHDHDDQIDPLMDACQLMLGENKKKGGAW